MIRHIVWWTLKPQVNGQTAADSAYFILNASAELQNCPDATHIEVSAKVEPTTTVPCMVVLLASFTNMEKFEAYKKDPIHLRFAKMVEERADSRNCIDYTLLPNLSQQ